MAVIDKLGYVDQLTPKEKVIIAAIAADIYHPELLNISAGDAKNLLKQIEQTAAPQPAPGSPQQQQDQEQKAAAEREANKFPNLSGKAHDAIVAYLAAKKAAPKKSAAAQPGLREKILKINWKTDLSGGIQRVAIANNIAPFGNGKARALVWNFPDEVPVHREPLYTPRRDLLPKYQTYTDRRDFRLPVLYRSIQENNYSTEFPLVLTTGRLVEYEGGGDETRSNKWLAELQQEMFAEVNTDDARRLGISNGKNIWLHTPDGARVKVAAMVTPRVGKGVVFMPFHFGGYWMGEDISSRYPKGTVPYVVGEAANTAMTYGYDVVTFMQESKVTLCRVEAA